MAEDIRKTGVTGLKGLKGINRTTPNDDLPTLEQLRALNRAYATGSKGPTLVNTTTTVPYASSNPMSQWGTSQYDNPIMNAPLDAGQIQDTRYENQPWYDVWLNGAGKMYGTAGTTFLSSLVGLPYGLFEVGKNLAEGKEEPWSAIWDNDFTKAMGDVDKWLEDNMTNYRSQQQQNSPWYDPNNLFSMNFIADDIIKNMGFTLGAAASMYVGSGALGLLSKGLGFVNKVSKAGQITNNVLGALFSASGEAMIEARQGVEERNKLEIQKLDDALAPEANALALEEQQINEEYAQTKGQALVRGYDGRYVDPAYENYTQRMQDLNARKQELNQKYEAGRAQIEESGQEMGNKIMLANQALLTAGNLIQFDRLLTRSFDGARHAAKISSKAARPLFVGATRAGKSIVDGYKVTGKVPGMVYAAGKGLVTEGSEEMNQQWIQSASGASVNETDINDYWRAKLDPEAYRETTKGLYTTGQVLSRGFEDSWGDLDQWEQFVIGGFTGLAGTYSPTKLLNQDKSKGIFNPARYGSWEGGVFTAIPEFNRQYRQYAENVDDLNRILAQGDFAARVGSMVGHTYNEDTKETAAEEGDKKTWKDADDKQMIHDIQAFVRAGKLDDLRAIYNDVSSSLTSEDIENIVKRTTREVTAEDDKRKHDSDIDEQIASKQREMQRYYDAIDNAYEESFNGDYIDGIIQENNTKIESLQSEIDALQNEKNSYIGQKRYEGPYVDANGNKIMTDDQIKGILKHNQEELNRKLESYLQSVDYVDKRTNGVLSKDQEDNLAYLHNLGKESNVRMQKIMAEVRKNLPKKFLLKTNKTPEQLNEETASSDLTFSKDENTKEGYVEVDTSLMNDAAFADFFQREIIRGGNIDPEFAETADEKALREEEEKNLPEEERKQKARERASKKEKDAIEKKVKEAKEQWNTNWDSIVDGFMENYRGSNNATLEETLAAFTSVAQDLQDASALYDQAGEFNRTLAEYMNNPSLVDKNKEKAEEEVNKAEAEHQSKNKLAGKSAQQMNQEIADGTLDVAAVEDLASLDLSDVSDGELQQAQKEAQTSLAIRQKANSLKNHIQENVSANPTEAELKEAEMMMNAVDNAVQTAETPEDISMANPVIYTPVLSDLDSNISPKELDGVVDSMRDKMTNAFQSMEESNAVLNDIPDVGTEDTPSISDVEAPVTGHDETTQLEPTVTSPDSTPSEAEKEIVPENPLTPDAIDTIVEETKKTYEKPNDNGTWRSTTTEFRYHESDVPYHESLSNKGTGLYKRSKAIHDYLEKEGAYERLSNASKDRIRKGDTIHFVVRYLPEVFGARIEEVSDKDKPYALAIFMVNSKGEVLADLPLAQLEPSYMAGTPTAQVNDLLAFQEKVFDAFLEYYKKNGGNEAVVDSELKIENVGNLNLTFDNAAHSPLVSKVKQVMRGVVPYTKNERNTLNDVAGDSSFELGARTEEINIAMRKGDKGSYKNIIIPTGSAGQPYLLLPTPSGEKMAVPFYMPMFDAEAHKETELYKQLTNAIYYLSIADPRDFKTIEKHKDVLKGLLQVKEQPNKRMVEVKSNQTLMHLQKLVGDDTIEIVVNNASSPAETAKALVDKLSGTPINVSLVFTNRDIETGITPAERRTANYNRVIGEIADVNLPKETSHTVNGWFTIEVLSEKGLKPSKNLTTKGSATQSASSAPSEAVKKVTPEPVPIERDTKTIEEVEDTMKQNKVVNRQTKDAWGVIEDTLKLRLVNEGVPLQFSYNGKKVIAGLANVQELIKTLKEANMAAKNGTLEVTEAAKPMEQSSETAQKENEREVRRWLAKNLPTLSSEERTQFVDKLAREGDNANKMWGNYKSGVIEIKRNAPEGTVYHEAFHYVMDMVLSPEEKQDVIELARKEYGRDLSYYAVEERLAEDFRRYALDENATGIVGTLKRWFRKLMDKINRYDRISDTTINQLFWKINNGEMAQKAVQVENYEEQQQRVLGEIRNVQKEKYSWRNLDAEIKGNLKASGLSQATYEQLSLELQEQYVKCRG